MFGDCGAEASRSREARGAKDGQRTGTHFAEPIGELERRENAQRMSSMKAVDNCDFNLEAGEREAAGSAR